MFRTRLGTGFVGLLLLSLLACEGPQAEGILKAPMSGGARIDNPSPTPEPRHDRASEFDSWDCVDELVDAEDFSQEWGEAAAR